MVEATLRGGLGPAAGPPTFDAELTEEVFLDRRRTEEPLRWWPVAPPPATAAAAIVPARGTALL